MARWDTKDPSSYSADDRGEFQVELKEATGGTPEGVFKGYASVFGKKDFQDDVVEPGAFARTLHQKGGRFPILFQHDPMEPIGQITEAVEDSRGLKVVGRLALGVQRANDTLHLVKAKAIQGLSIGYRTVKHEMNNDTGVRHLKEIELFEISPVVFPANPHARISGIKSAIAFQDLELAEKKDDDVTTLSEWAGDDKEKLRSAHLLVKDGEYFFPIAEVVNGKLVATRGAILKAGIEVFSNNCLEEDEMTMTMRHLDRYYRKIKCMAPWGASSFKDVVQSVLDHAKYIEPESIKALEAAVASREDPSEKSAFSWSEHFGDRPVPEAEEATAAFGWLDKFATDD